MRARWSSLGGRLGVGFCVAGLALVFLGWNGAASWDRVPSQFPYLISGGVAGLSLVVIGAALMIVQNQRTDRARLEARLVELREVIEAAAPPPSATLHGDDGGALVVAGPTTFHTPACRTVEGRGALPTMTVAQALARGLEPCRTCAPLAGAAEPVRPHRRRTDV